MHGHHKPVKLCPGQRRGGGDGAVAAGRAGRPTVLALEPVGLAGRRRDVTRRAHRRVWCAAGGRVYICGVR